jgi:nucleoid-associated protein YgaU
MLRAPGRIVASLAIATGVLLAACGSGAEPAPTPVSPAATAPSPAASPPSIIPPSPSPSPAASPSPGAGESYTVGEGDTLASIAERFYGDPALWRRIYDANRQAIGDNPDSLRLGTVLTIPPRP